MTAPKAKVVVPTVNDVTVNAVEETKVVVKTKEVKEPKFVIEKVIEN